METKYVEIEVSRVISALVHLYTIVQNEKEADSARESARKLSRTLLRLLNKSSLHAISGLSDVKQVKVPVSIAEQVFQNESQKGSKG